MKFISQPPRFSFSSFLPIKIRGKTRGKNHTETLCTCRQVHKWRRERWRKRNSCQNNNEIKSNLGGLIRVFTDKKYVCIDMFALSWCSKYWYWFSEFWRCFYAFFCFCWRWSRSSGWWSHWVFWRCQGTKPVSLRGSWQHCYPCSAGNFRQGIWQRQRWKVCWMHYGRSAWSSLQRSLLTI